MAATLLGRAVTPHTGCAGNFEKKLLYPLYKHPTLCYTISCSRGISAAGSAQHWQCWGQEFESPMLHAEIRADNRFGFFLVFPTISIRPEPIVSCRRWIRITSLSRTRRTCTEAQETAPQAKKNNVTKRGTTNLHQARCPSVFLQAASFGEPLFRSACMACSRCLWANSR